MRGTPPRHVAHAARPSRRAPRRASSRLTHGRPCSPLQPSRPPKERTHARTHPRPDPSSTTRTMRGADRLIEALQREGTDCVFGLPGGASLPIHDALHDSAIRHVLVRHEAGAGHAAEGYAKASGRVGVALVTSGPGATNLATPIADAHMDSVPTVFLTAQVRSDLRGHERLPGDRRARHDRADLQALDRRRAPRRRRRRDPRGVPRRPHRAAGAGGRRHPERHRAGPGPRG